MRDERKFEPMNHERKRWKHTLLNWIFVMSSSDCRKPGNFCFRHKRRLSALLARISLLFVSIPLLSFIMTHECLPVKSVCFVYFPDFLNGLLHRHTWMAASILLAISTALCSVDKSRVCSMASAQKLSPIMCL